MELNETLQLFGFTQEKLDLLENNAWWSKPYDWEAKHLPAPYWVQAKRFVEGITLLPLPLSDRQASWLMRIRDSIMPCEYSSKFHRGKVEWHHPIKGRLDIGMFLCEAHHSILQGRKERYWPEVCEGKPSEEIRRDLIHLEMWKIHLAGLDPILANKR